MNAEKGKRVPDYSLADHPSTLRFIFYPREDVTPCPENAFDLQVPVGSHAAIACRFHVGHQEWPWILFFHGNGEVVSDYDEVASVYHEKKLNLAVADYRGYGASSGVPTLSDLVRDAHALFEATKKALSEKGFRSDLWVMGRSLGSISALELAFHHPGELKGVIIESGFPSVVRIITHLGVPAPGIPLEAIDQACLEMIQKTVVPTLVIHGERDTLVPLKEAEELYRHLGTKEKELVIIPGATHNDIFYVGFQKYFETIQQFVLKTDKAKNPNRE
jgi:pimeloyl-ACP methyl ester carboxylesterase